MGSMPSFSWFGPRDLELDGVGGAADRGMGVLQQLPEHAASPSPGLFTAEFIEVSLIKHEEVRTAGMSRPPGLLEPRPRHYPGFISAPPCPPQASRSSYANCLRCAAGATPPRYARLALSSSPAAVLPLSAWLMGDHVPGQ
ncbi:hypothetical protein SEVIR_1G365050v4 [Setaria viridis]